MQWVRQKEERILRVYLVGEVLVQYAIELALNYCGISSQKTERLRYVRCVVTNKRSVIMIRQYKESDLSMCAKFMMDVYNNDLWQCHWSLEIAKRYLQDFVNNKKFIGFTLVIDHEIKGAIFAHEKIWWDNSEIFIDEMFISPELQRKGYGSELLQTIENYARTNNLAGFTLTTNRHAPAPIFYRKNGFVDCDHVLYMGKGFE